MRRTNYLFTKAGPGVSGGITNTGNYPPSAASYPAGELRLKRTGSTYEAFYRTKGSSTWSSMSTQSGPTDDMNLYLSVFYKKRSGYVQVNNFRFLSGGSRASEGVFLSSIYDAGKSVSWDRIQWTEDLPTGCDVELEVCVADDFAEFENFASPPAFFGPSGGGAFTTPSGQDLPSGKTGRYAMVRAVLTGNGTDTPTLSDIQMTCNSASDTGSRVIRTQYDEAGNILRITTIDDLGVSEDVRDDAGWSSGDRINSLNQIMRQDVGGDTWTFSYDLNGNMTGKTNGVDTWTYTWNDENRLIRVQGPGGVDVAHVYDSAGRMISRDDGTDVTTFVWDGFDCIREQTGISTTTYCIPEGVLTSFIRDGDRYDIHTDALGSVRLVTDDNGDVVARLEYSAFGSQLASSGDNVPGGMPYGFVGALGVRFDSATGLHYMRARWYDSSSQRFISRDPIGQRGGNNLYAYVKNRPLNLVDPTGLAGTTRVPIPGEFDVPMMGGPELPAGADDGGIDFHFKLNMECECPEDYPVLSRYSIRRSTPGKNGDTYPEFLPPDFSSRIGGGVVDIYMDSARSPVVMSPITGMPMQMEDFPRDKPIPQPPMPKPKRPQPDDQWWVSGDCWCKKCEGDSEEKPGRLIFRGGSGKWEFGWGPPWA